MKLKDYFIAQKEHKINENDKFFLYEKIISQKNKRNLRHIKISDFVNIKSFAYWFVMIILLVWIYWIYFFNGDFSYEWFMVKNNSNIVTADYIANVVEFNWDFYIKHDGKYYKTNKISNWDNVILKKWSEIVFDIDSSTKAKIVWPARFSLQKDENNYKLMISEWDFIQMESIEKSDNSMEIVLNDITISSDKNINLLVTKQNNEYKINNQWDKLLIKKDNKTQELMSKQLLAIKDNDISLIKNIQDFWQAIAKQDISQTFTMVDQKNEKPEKITEMFIKEVTSESNESVDIWLAKDLWFVDSKDIPTKDQTKELYSILNNDSILFELEWMYKNQLLWNQKEYNYSKWSLESKIQKTYKLFNLSYSKEDIISNIISLKEQLEMRYHIPSKYISNLEILSRRINYIQSLDNWSNTNIEEVGQLWENIKTNPPSNLVLK